MLLHRPHGQHRYPIIRHRLANLRPGEFFVPILIRHKLKKEPLCHIIPISPIPYDPPPPSSRSASTLASPSDLPAPPSFAARPMSSPPPKPPSAPSTSWAAAPVSTKVKKSISFIPASLTPTPTFSTIKSFPPTPPPRPPLSSPPPCPP